ncbi:MAG: DUF2199 domain-containing protein [Candidatus Omnitrophica bacterium]|nr:DUF2199 domain-containing protein [Candidatus Omnitrophota bacterium]MCB9722239.1 DUF2199 domain-containing protein [Candidatus Omnitrophota bacterium]
MNEERRICSVCGEFHPQAEMELAFRRPDLVCELPVAEREADCLESDDICILRKEHYFIRAVLPMPVADRKEPYRIGLWVEVDKVDFQRVHALWDDPAQADEPPFAVRIANHIPQLPQTLGLSASLQLTGRTTRPEISIGDPAHPLYTEQQDGIDMGRIDEYNHLF